VLLVAGCGVPPVADPGGLPVQRPLLVAAVANGWLVVDSSHARVRAVAQLTRWVPRGDGERWTSTRPLLRCAAGLAASVVRVRRDPPVCRQASSEDACAGGRPCANRVGDAAACSQVVRAEFALDRLPHVGDSLTLIERDDTSRARWSRP
jgi:hypothetical protein